MSSSTFNRNQAIWRSRRGLLELDLYLTPFAEACFDKLPADFKTVYGELLECEDPEILGWLKDGTDVPSEYVSIVAKITDFARSSTGCDSSN